MLAVGLAGYSAAPVRSAISLSDWFQGTTSPYRMMTPEEQMAVPKGRQVRAVYPYSVVPGGVRTPQELREASTHDPIVAGHYAGFNFQQARVIGLREAKLAYLSYRIKDRIYWTAKKIRLAKGEKLITDGKITARTRCANQVSELPQQAVSHDEPVASNFEQPVESAPAEVPFPSALLVRPIPGGFDSVQPPHVSGAGTPPIHPIIGPIGGGGHPPFFPPPPPLIPPKTGVPDAVPGPGTMLLFLAAAFGFYLRRRKMAT